MTTLQIVLFVVLFAITIVSFVFYVNYPKSYSLAGFVSIGVICTLSWITFIVLSYSHVKKIENARKEERISKSCKDSGFSGFSGFSEEKGLYTIITDTNGYKIYISKDQNTLIIHKGE